MENRELVQILLKALAVYFVAANAIYIVLLFLSWLDLKKRTTKGKANRPTRESQANSSPRMTFMVPAFNEEKVIIEAMHAHLTITYENLEVIVIDDGSTDKTAELIIQEFKMVPVNLSRNHQISNAKILGSFRSTLDSRLVLLRQANRGKAGALNTALDFATGEFCCTVDADTIPEKNCIPALIRAFADDTKEVVAVGGTVRIANGAYYENHQIVQGHLPRSMLLNFQIIEYIRAFYCGRSGWEWVNATLLLSGAMATFRTSALRDVHGFDQTSITEDLEIILRLRWQAVAHRKNWAIRLIPEPLCWTQAPSSLKQLRKQRIRWQQGLSQTMWKYFSLIFNPSYSVAGFVHMPYVLGFEWLGAWIELGAYIVGGAAWYLGILQIKTVLSFVALGLLYSCVVSIVSIHFEEHYFARHHSTSTKFKFLLGVVLENFGYRQFNWFVRLEGMVRLLFEKPTWGQQARHSIKNETAKAKEAA